MSGRLVRHSDESRTYKGTKDKRIRISYEIDFRSLSAPLRFALLRLEIKDDPDDTELALFYFTW